MKQQKKEETIRYPIKLSYNKVFFKKSNCNIKEKTQIIILFTYKPVYLGLSILEISKIVINEFQYDYIKPKYNEKEKLCYIDADSFIVHVKTEDIYKNIAEDVEKTFNTSNYQLERLLPKRKNKKFTCLMKDELDGEIIKASVGIRAKTYSYLTDVNNESKKAKSTMKCITKIKLEFARLQKPFWSNSAWKWKTFE